MNKAYFLFAAFLIFSNASASDSLYSLAQKLYSQGNFEAAAKNYANACPQFGAREKKICLFNEVKALAESNKTDLARAAEQKLLSLISQTEPNDSLFAELNAENSKLQIILNKPAQAVRSWNAAQASANTDYFSELLVICRDIVSAFPENGLTAENCNKVKPADTSLISLPRKKITPLKDGNIKEGKWYIQLGAFGNKENAERLIADFKSIGVQLYITELADKKLFTVRAGNFATQDEARDFAEQKIAPTHKNYKIFQ